MFHIDFSIVVLPCGVLSKMQLRLEKREYLSHILLMHQLILRMFKNTWLIFSFSYRQTIFVPLTLIKCATVNVKFFQIHLTFH